MDYREFIEKYGNKLNKAISDQQYIDWLISVLKLEGFGSNKQTDIIDGFNTKAVKISEDGSNIVYRIDNIDSTPPTTESTVQEGSVFEYGQAFNAGDLTVDVVVTRNTYKLVSVVFTGLDEADKDEVDINAAGVNSNLAVPFPWSLPNISSTGTLSNGDDVIGTVTSTDDLGQVDIHTVRILRQDRWMWGLTRTPQTSADIATLLGSASGNIVPSDGDSDFYELTTGLGTLPSEFNINTFGADRTFFIASQEDVDLKLEGGIPYDITDSVEVINLNSISSGNANLSRNHNVRVMDFNTVVTLIKV